MSASGYLQRLAAYARLARLHRPIGWLLLMWPTLWAVWMAADGRPEPRLVAIFVLGVLAMRSAGCIVNDILDRRFDAEVKRTADRPLVTGEVSLNEALLALLAFLAAAAILALQLNLLALKLAVVGLAVAAIYPLMKRVTYYPQLILGVAFSWGIPMGYAATLGSVPREAWLLVIANIFWTVAYDTEYAMVDRDDDLRIGVKSTAILFEELDRHIIGILYGLFVLTLLLVAHHAGLGVPFMLATFVAIGLGVRQQQLIHDREREGCFKAFKSNNWVGASIFAGIVLDYLV